MAMNIQIEEMTIEHYEQVVALWCGFEGVGLSHDDSKENISRFLSRNPGMSLVAFDGDCLVGAVLCGHDGRRGYMYHLATKKDYQRQGIGSTLAERGLAALKGRGINHCHVFAFSGNREAVKFWEKLGWERFEEVANFISGDIREQLAKFRR